MNVFEWLETTTVALTVRDSLLLTAGLSAVHLLGFTLVTGAALVANLRLLGALLPSRPAVEITGPTSRGIAVGLILSVSTGLFMFAPRALAASANDTFRLKMLLLLAATAFHFTAHVAISRRASSAPLLSRSVGAIGLTLWLGLALAGCAFILLE